MKRLKVTLILAVFLILFSIYFISIIFESDFWGNILSPLSIALASFLLLYVYMKSGRKSAISIAILMVSFACLFWTIADVIWAISSFCGGDPSENSLITNLYLMTNVFLSAAVFLFLFFHFSKWNTIQFILDILAIGVSCILLMWIVFFNRSQSGIEFLVSDGFSSVASIVLDIVSMIGIFVWFFSVRTGKIPRFLRLIAIGVILYILIDLYYYYIYVKDIYTPNSIIDSLYLASLLIIALGIFLAFHNNIVNTTILDMNSFKNIGFKRRHHYLLIFPLVALLSEGCVLGDIIFFLLVFVFYGAASRYVQMAIQNEELLKKELEINIRLEKRVEEQLSELHFLANQDTVTKLYNRRFFSNSLETSLNELQRNEIVALLMIDADRFKMINDNYGHDIGDKVLIEVSNRLINWNKYGAILARLGGDEFAVLFRGEYSKSELEGYVQNIVKICSEPIVIDQYVLYITISIGISIYPLDSSDSVSLMKNADIAMYRAKSQGYNRYVFFNPFFNESINKNNEIENLLRMANIENDFELFYQPQFSLPSQKLIGAEALLRWKNTEHGYIPPSEFIPVAEEIDYIIRIGTWVMNEAITQISKWNNTYSIELKMGFNISPKQLYDEKFASTLKNLIKKENVKSLWLDAEITENIMLQDGREIDSVFDLFNDLGITVSIDDFGSGYSSLGYLNKYNFDRIKIDKTMIDNIASVNKSGIEVVKAVILMSKAIDKKTIAEGVETPEQLDILLNLGCDEVQGYLLGRPVPASIFEDIFIKNR